MSFRAFSSRGSSLMQSIAETCVCFDAAHLSINLVSEIAVPMFPTLNHLQCPTLVSVLQANRRDIFQKRRLVSTLCQH